VIEVTPNCVPYCVELPKLNVMFIGNAPSGGIEAGERQVAAGRAR
jgi:hypothetical protein